MWRVFLLLLLAACAGGDPVLPPADAEPARVMIVGVGRTIHLSDQLVVPVALDNEGGPGFFKLRFNSARSGASATPEWTLETEPAPVSRGYRATVSYRLVGVGASPLEGISVFSRGESSAHYTQWHVYVPTPPGS